MADPDLLFSRPAGHVRGKMAPVGGTLIVKDDRLVFEPNRVASGMGAEKWARPLRFIDQVSATKRDPRDAMNGGLKPRLAVDLNDGTRELFTLPRAAAAAEQLQLALPDARPSSPGEEAHGTPRERGRRKRRPGDR